MMGRTHALTGALAGLVVGQAVGLDTAALGPFAVTAAGYALLPDLDHPSSTASRLLGPITGIVSTLLRGASGFLYARTKGPDDEQGSGKHRHLTHTVAFAALFGGVCAVSTCYGGHWAVVGWLVFGLLLAADRLGKLALVAFAAGAVSWLPALQAGHGAFGHAVLATLDDTTGWLGIAVGLGCVVHCLGDALTESGCPFLWPWLIRGETWFEIRPPAWLRFRTNSAVENVLVLPAVVIGCVAAIPGLLPHLIDAVRQHDWTALRGAGT